MISYLPIRRPKKKKKKRGSKGDDEPDKRSIGVCVCPCVLGNWEVEDKHRRIDGYPIPRLGAFGEVNEDEDNDLKESPWLAKRLEDIIVGCSC